MSKTLDQTSLLDLVPDSIKRDKSVSSAGKALDPLLQEVTAALDLPSIYVSIDGLSSEQLDHLAYAWDASVWRDSWPIELKRSVVKNVVTEKRKKGTVRAVRDALASIQSAATIKEWWETDPKGTPHTFTIYATLGKIDVLRGFKENVITGHLIPAGTGSEKFQHLHMVKLGEEIPIEKPVVELPEQKKEESIENIDFGDDDDIDDIFSDKEMDDDFADRGGEGAFVDDEYEDDKDEFDDEIDDSEFDPTIDYEKE